MDGIAGGVAGAAAERGAGWTVGRVQIIIQVAKYQLGKFSSVRDRDRTPLS